MNVLKCEGERCTLCPQREYVNGTGGLGFTTLPPNSVVAVIEKDGKMRAYCWWHATMIVGVRRLHDIVGKTMAHH